MGYRRLRGICQRRLNGLDLPELHDIRTFCAALAESRGRMITLVPITGGDAGIWGMWAATASADVIFYRSSISPLHREHLVLHEISHMLCDHAPAMASDAEWATTLLPSLNPAMVRRVLARSGYHDHQEREAELLASLILGRARSAGVPRTLTRARESGTVHRRLYPLWRAVHAVHPEIALLSAPGPVADALAVRDLDLRLYRRVIEIWDGMMMLRSRTGPYVAVRARTEAERIGIPEQEIPAYVEAARLVVAIRAAGSAFDPADARRGAVTFADAGGVGGDMRAAATEPEQHGNLRAEIAYLTRVAHYLRGMIVHRAVSRANASGPELRW